MKYVTTAPSTLANKSNETVKNFAPEIVIAFWHCWQTICTKVLASSEPSYQWHEYAASITDELYLDDTNLIVSKSVVNFYLILTSSINRLPKMQNKKTCAKAYPRYLLNERSLNLLFWLPYNQVRRKVKTLLTPKRSKHKHWHPRF